MSRGKRTENLPRRLTLPFVLEEGRVPGMATKLLYLASAFVVACVAWASITEIRELAVATGQIKPAGSTQLVQHLEGGIVSEILVDEGQLVTRGDPMVRLQPTAANSDLHQIQIRDATLTLQVERQTAALEGRHPNFGDLAKSFPDLAQDQLETFRSEGDQHAQTKDSLIARVEQKLTEVETLQGEAESLVLRLKIEQEQLDIRKKLQEQGFASRATVLDVQRRYEETKGQMMSVRGRLATAQKALNEARIKLLEADAEFTRRLTEERTRASAELAEIKQQSTKQQDRVDRLLVRAPVNGIVQELVPKALGQVMQPGEMIAQIVPQEQELIAEVRIDPKDIGHVAVGAPAEIKITTFDPARFGSIGGEVRRISASTFQDEKGEPYYKVIVALGHNHVGLGAERHRVLPGMVVNAEIITGAKSLTRYMLKPVYRSLDIAFTER
ncbi:MAG: HlyD family type I secretion periplasmic adaptor subunit [Hyphomicrobiales bacterium]